jgi:hypothetical protein
VSTAVHNGHGGCDCFGCCTFPELAGRGPDNGPGYVWIGAMDDKNNGTCTFADVLDQAKCPPCTPVQGCWNECGTCELCLGKDTLSPECTPPAPDAGSRTSAPACTGFVRQDEPAACTGRGVIGDLLFRDFAAAACDGRGEKACCWCPRMTGTSAFDGSRAPSSAARIPHVEAASSARIRSFHAGWSIPRSAASSAAPARAAFAVTPDPTEPIEGERPKEVEIGRRTHQKPSGCVGERLCC